MPAKKHITKEMILSEAFKMLREGGMSAVNVKALAGRLNCSTQPIYLSFNNMDDLRAELGVKAVRTFQEKMRGKNGAVRLYGMDYIRFAQEEKALFCFLFMRRNAFSEMKEVLTPLMNESISGVMDRYEISWEEAHYLHDHLWMHSHGIASMIATGFCDWDDEKVQRMITECERYLGGKSPVEKCEAEHVQ